MNREPANVSVSSNWQGSARSAAALAAIFAAACSGSAVRGSDNTPGSGGSADAGTGTGTATDAGPDATGSTTEAGTSDASTVGFGQNIPRSAFCSHAPKSGIVVPDPRVPLSQAANAPDVAGVCTGDLAKRTFRFGLCSCQDLNVNGTLTTDAFNSGTGATSKDGSIGVRTHMVATSLFNIGGSLWVGGLDTATQPVLEINGVDSIAGELRVGGDLGGSSFLEVGADAYVKGDVGSSVFASIAGALHVPTGASVGAASAKGGVQQGPVSIADPCNCDNPLDIGAIVSAFASVNDNAASGVSSTALIAPAGTSLTLECGRYYFEGVDIGGLTNLHLTGRTAIFVEGDFAARSILSLQLDPGAELDLFVTGNVTLEGATNFGSKNEPARIRMYVGGTQISLVSLATLGANVYARSATVEANGTLSMWGSLYADRVALTSLADFHYDSAILETEGCEPPEQVCDDCQTCSGGSCIAGTCAPCKTSADCCAPLTCSSGACVPFDGPV